MVDRKREIALSNYDIDPIENKTYFIKIRKLSIDGGLPLFFIQYFGSG